jgi:hypothetical protein
MIICSSSNIDLIQGVSGYGTVADGATDWRIENTSTGVFNILNSPNLLAPNVSIIDVGNVGIGTIPITGTNKLQVQGAASVSGLITANAGITVNTGSLTCANDTLSKTYTATNTTAGTNDILTMRYDTTNGIRFRQTLVAANDVRYDLIQKTNNVDYTAPVISFYKGNVGIGTTNPVNILQVGSGGRLRLANDNTDSTLIGASDANSATNPRIIISGITRSGNQGNIEYLSTTSTGMHAFYTTDSTTERMRIASNGNVGIGTTDTTTYKLNVGGTINATSVLVNGAAITASSPSQWIGTTNIYYNGGNVGIGTNNPGNIFQIGGAGRLRISNGAHDYTIIGTNDIDDSTNTRIVISGNTRGGVLSGDITYLATSTGLHRFITESSNERMRIASNGNVGIGTTDVTAKLTVISDNSKIAEFKNTALTAGLAIGYEAIQTCGTNTNQSIFIIGRGTGNIEFRTNETANMVIGGDGYITYFGHKQPFSRCGTVNSFQADFPTLFDVTTTTVHTCEITFQWHMNTGTGGIGITLHGLNNAGTESVPTEVGYRDASYNTAYTVSAGNVIARFVTLQVPSFTKIRIVRIEGTFSRAHYICETIYCAENIGTTQNISTGWLNAGDKTPKIRLKTTDNSTNFKGSWTATYYHV